MHLHVIICFALLIWWPQERPPEAAATPLLWTWLTVWVQVPLFLLAAAWASRIAQARLAGGPTEASRAHLFCHRATVGLRAACVLAFVAILFLTGWVEQVRSIGSLSVVPGLADLAVLLPFLTTCTAIFLGLYPIDRAIHQAIVNGRTPEGAAAGLSVWTCREYLNFNIRHHLLVVTVPMMLVLAAFDLARDHQEFLVRSLRIPWAADAVPGLAAAVIFVFAPLMLRHIWTTRPLPDGALRRELQRICDRIGLAYRDILIWQSGGMMVNAAVMGMFPRVRYVMLSDGLLEAMSTEQIQAVFGHEAGHVRHRHIQFFLLFAVCSMLLLSAVVEALRLGVEHQYFQISLLTVQAVGLAVALLLWGIGFGWLSRRFERQADLFGTHCVTTDDPTQCPLPCSIHQAQPGRPTPPSGVCATAAGVFISALDRVALLNGIPHEERSWRHSSIASRVRFLTSLTGDPGRAHRFERRIRRVKRTLLAAAIAGSLLGIAYVWDHPIYGLGAGIGTAPTTPAVRQPAEASQ